MSEEEKSSSPITGESRKGLSKEAWVAISTIAAALITGIVTLVINLTPKPAATAATPAATASVVSSPAPATSSINADEIAGKWSGKAKTDSTGEEFDITLEVRKSCGINQSCGSITVSNGPCYGEITLERVHQPIFEFNVVRFFGESNREKCATGAGEEFQLRPDGKLDYHARWEPTAEGFLERQKD